MQINLLEIISSTIRLPKHWIVYCLLFAITIQSLTSGVVLCFENDGHIVVEFGSNEKCCSSFYETSQKTPNVISIDQDFNSSCGTCFDVPLYISAEKKNNYESIDRDFLLTLVQTSSTSSTSFISPQTLKTPFHPILTTSFHISTIQTAILQV